MTLQAPVRTGHQMTPSPVAEHQAWSTRGVKVLVSGVVALLAGVAVLLYSGKQTGGAATALVWAGILLLITAAEIAQAMLRQQQASAIVGARMKIVEGAVGMVQLALRRLEEQDVVELDEERKAAMVSNLLVVLCSEQATQQVVNTGSLYQ